MRTPSLRRPVAAAPKALVPPGSTVRVRAAPDEPATARRTHPITRRPDDMTAPAPGPGADDGLVLTAAQACDLDLALGGALPRAHLLGGALHDDAGRGPRDLRDLRDAVVALRAADVADRQPPFALRDAEHTPLAQVDVWRPIRLGPTSSSPTSAADGSRESRPLASLALDLDARGPRPGGPRGARAAASAGRRRRPCGATSSSGPPVRCPGRRWCSSRRAATSPTTCLRGRPRPWLGTLLGGRA